MILASATPENADQKAPKLRADARRNRDKLIEIAKKDPNPELRKRALFWLGQSDQARAVQAIQDIIDQP